MQTLQDIVDSGLDLRVWCYGCLFSKDWDARDVLRRLLDGEEALDMGWLKERLRCPICGEADTVIVPIKRPPEPPKPPPRRPRTWAEEVASFFHANRAASKRGRRH